MRVFDVAILFDFLGDRAFFLTTLAHMTIEHTSNITSDVD